MPMSKTLVLVVSLLASSAAAQVRDPALTLWYDQPARQWVEALPIGNGRLGAMVFGGTARERIQFNESTIWTGYPHEYQRPGAHRYLAELRELLWAGKQIEAQQLASVHFMSAPVRQRTYMTFGDLTIVHTGVDSTQIEGYRRELDLDEAVTTTSFVARGVRYRREVFASHPHQVVVVRLSADRPGALAFTITPSTLHRWRLRRRAGSDQLSLRGGLDSGVVTFEARLRVTAEGGRVAVNDSTITVGDASSATIILAGATNWVSPTDVSGDPVARNDRTMAAVRTLSYDALRAAHRRDHQALFRRMSISLGTVSPASSLPTDERVLRFRERKDPALATLLFQYGRYLLIASSRPGGQPATLQGLWNDSNAPPWDSKYTVNINTEMNYWLAEPANLAELHRPLFDMLKQAAVSGARTAREHYRARGWVLHHNTDLWRGTAPINNSNHGVWPTGGAWLAQHLWWHYEYGGDRQYLRETAYPLMKGAALFFVDALVRDPRSGHLVSGPSNSPENGGLVMGPTMDHQIIRDLFANVIRASEILGVDDPLRAQLIAMRARIAPNRIGRLGQLQEWLEDKDDSTNKHRHVSHLWGLHPGAEITARGTPDLFAAARKSLEFRGDGGTGWSMAWKINFWARLLDGDHSYRMLENLLTLTGSPKTTNTAGGVYPNLFDAHPPFQIDGNFGATSGIIEMLLQNHAGAIELLPALPSAWPEGRVRGLRVRGGHLVDLSWANGSLTEARITSPRAGAYTIRYRNRLQSYRTTPGQTVVFKP